MDRKPVLVHIILLVCSVGLNCNAQSIDSREDDIDQFIRSYYAIMSDREWDSYRAFFTRKATLSTIWQEHEGADKTIMTYTIDDFLSQTSKGPDSQPIFSEKPVTVAIEIKKGLASVWVNYKAIFGSEDNLMEWTGNDLFTLILFEGEWKIVSIAYLSDVN